MKKQSKRKTTNFKSSILLLLLMAVLLISSTYAWFTANQTVTISSIQVNVKASNGLQISTDGTNWKPVIQNADLIANIATSYPTNTNQVPTEMAPVSTDGSVTSGKLNLYYGQVTTSGSDYILTASKETDTKGTIGRYIVFDIFLKVDADTPIYLTPNSKVEKVGDNDVGLQNAARVAFINEGTAAASESLTTIQALNSGSTSAIWEPNNISHTDAAKNNAKNNYGFSDSDFTSVLPYYGVKDEISSADNIPLQQLTTKTANPNAEKFAKVTPTYSTVASFPSNVSFTTLTTGITKYRVYMWIEGQDVDCDNSASGTDITYSLQFTATNG